VPCQRRADTALALGTVTGRTSDPLEDLVASGGQIDTGRLARGRVVGPTRRDDQGEGEQGDPEGSGT